jgi:palmitoyltransferase
MTGIGQCVGARNRKFFVIFLFWSSLLSTYLFVSLLALNIMAMNDSNVDVDPPQIVLVAL